MVRKASRVGVLALVLAACGPRPAREPAWPKLHEREADGGESLEPRQASSVAAIEKAEDAKPSAPEPGAPAAGAPAAGAPAARPEAPAPEAPRDAADVQITEEIVIEIEDEDED